MVSPRQPMSVAAAILAAASILLFLAGFVFVGFYTGPHLHYLGIGWLTGCASFVVGGLVGLIVGIPRFVSSGALRHDVESNRLPTRHTAPAGRATHPAAQAHTAVAESGGAAADPSAVAQGATAQGTAAVEVAGSAGSRFTPSTNLAEISDWLTKLLLGAGLVELTRLGKPLASLIDTVARGLAGTPSGTPVSGQPVVVAAALLVTYVVLGFLDGYVITTVWYDRRMQRLGYN